ncbi:TCR/Tet family MFS transporter [Woodsholea maritima]|uniref:TCR/Tet family MFS transporter n=1 Tax=Woodsholea maritima TaxID=240237 RepID=UPI00037FA2BD|nr:tetracycline resistance MFS efflux pump [Woodsholea maritima]
MINGFGARKHALAFIFVTVLLDMIAFGIIIPVMPNLIEDVTGLPIARAATQGAVLTMVYAGMQFLCAPIVGAMSDRFGRRAVLMVSMAGLSVDFLIMALAPSFWVLLLGRIMGGAFGATFSTAFAVIADVSPPEKRSANFGLIGAAFGLGFIIGPAIGGFLGELGPRAPFFAASILAAMNFIYGMIVLSETLAQENRRAFNWRRANPVGALYHVAQNKTVIWLMLASFLVMLGHSVYPAIWSYFAQLKFNWSSGDVGLSLMVVGILAALVQGGLTRKVIPLLGEWKVLVLGLCVVIIAYLAYGFVPEGWMVYPIIVFASISGMAQPAMQGIMSNATPANAQGELQGAMGSMQSLSFFFGPLIYSHVFEMFSDKSSAHYQPGMPFVFAAGFTALALVIAYYGYHVRLKRTHERLS